MENKENTTISEKDKEQLNLEIQHIFNSGANEVRVFDMVINFINKRYVQKYFKCYGNRTLKTTKKCDVFCGEKVCLIPENVKNKKLTKQPDVYKKEDLCCCDNPNGFKEMENGKEFCSKCKQPY